MSDIEGTQKRTDGNYANMILTTNTSKENKMRGLKRILQKKKKKFNYWRKIYEFPHTWESQRKISKYFDNSKWN